MVAHQPVQTGSDPASVFMDAPYLLLLLPGFFNADAASSAAGGAGAGAACRQWKLMEVVTLQMAKMSNDARVITKGNQTTKEAEDRKETTNIVRITRIQ